MWSKCPVNKTRISLNKNEGTIIVKGKIETEYNIVSEENK